MARTDEEGRERGTYAESWMACRKCVVSSAESGRMRTLQPSINVLDSECRTIWRRTGEWYARMPRVTRNRVFSAFRMMSPFLNHRWGEFTRLAVSMTERGVSRVTK